MQQWLRGALRPISLADVRLMSGLSVLTWTAMSMGFDVYRRSDSGYSDAWPKEIAQDSFSLLLRALALYAFTPKLLGYVRSHVNDLAYGLNKKADDGRAHWRRSLRPTAQLSVVASLALLYMAHAKFDRPLLAMMEVAAETGFTALTFSVLKMAVVRRANKQLDARQAASHEEGTPTTPTPARAMRP